LYRACRSSTPLHRYADGVDDGATFVSNVREEALLSNFSQLESADTDPNKDAAGWAMQQLAASLMLPLLQLTMNQNAQGSAIHKPDERVGSKLKSAKCRLVPHRSSRMRRRRSMTVRA
jgi:hypothetical protein